MPSATTTTRKSVICNPSPKICPLTFSHLLRFRDVLLKDEGYRREQAGVVVGNDLVERGLAAREG